MKDVFSSFDADRQRLADACERVATAARRSNFSLPTVVERISAVAVVLKGEYSWEDQSSAAASLRGFFHRDGIHDVPGPPNMPSWATDLNLLNQLSTIFVESRYREAVRKRFPAVQE
ncbi:MAG: hypothetical protein EOP12_02850 [Pseudomonas sp.]|nr:MAG: hypothetical protein EOP12_02850 [Pseudomonas sp.]